MGDRNFNAMLKKAEEVGEFLREEANKNSKFTVVTHFDADGLASGGVFGKALIRLGASFQVRVIEQLDEDSLRKVLNLKGDVIIFSEIGSGYLSLISSASKKKKILIVDHHQPEACPKEDPRLLHLNPHDYGFDGAKEISGAGMAYLVAKELDERNLDLSPLAVVGALGDVQDKNQDRSLKGLNEKIVEEGRKAGYIKAEVDLILHGRRTKPIHKALAHSTNPFLPGLSGEEDNCVSLLSSIGIPLKHDGGWVKVSDLSMDEKKKLLTKIIEYISSRGFPGSVALNLIGTNYEVLGEGDPLADAREYAFVLNACGRMGKSGLGIALCLGDRGEALLETRRLISEYRHLLAEYMAWIAQSPDKVQEYPRFYAIRGEGIIKEKMTGAISTMLVSSTTFKPSKAVMVLALSEGGGIKISARAPPSFSEKKINLGAILKTCSEKFYGLGGGHDLAAGAYLPGGIDVEEFLKAVDEEISKGIKNEGNN
ncbi:TPA: DHH family phosphoesterase [Candidatus Bathyarchaeota archaeon]|nr:DHH family phosphoesterase [Candidatus Bathyarchaeota archaeon]